MTSEIVPKGSGFSPYHLKALFFLLLTDEEYRDKYFSILKPEHFKSDKYLHILARAYWLMYERFGIFPDPGTLSEELFSQRGTNIELFNTPVSNETLELLGTYFIGLMEIDPPSPQYISAITLKVIKLSAIHNILGQNKAALMDGTVDVDSIAQDIFEVSSISEKRSLGVNALKNLDKRTEERLTLDPLARVIPIQIPGITEHIEDGGVPRGTLSFFLAPTGTGKTTGLITVSKTAMLANKKVLYVSAELSNYEIMKRFDSAMSGIAKREVRMRAAEVREKLMSSERYKRALANLVSIEVPMGSTTVKDLDIVIKELHKEDFVPDFLVVDYADNLAPLKYIPNATRLEIYSIYRDLRALGQTFDLAAFTASQTNDMGTAAAEDEKQHMSVRHSNEARAKTHIADLIIGLARTVAERQNNEARAVLLKNRFGGNEGAVVKIFPDFDRSLMWTASATPLMYASQEEARAANYGVPDSEEGAAQASLLDSIVAGIADAEQNPPEA